MRRNASIGLVLSVVLVAAVVGMMLIFGNFFKEPSPPSAAAGIDLVAAVTACNCVMFRLDDIQDFHEVPEQIAIMDIFKNENTTLTIGIIGNSFGRDVRIVNYIKANMDHLTIANHGWEHEDFSLVPTLAGQAELLKKTNNKVNDILHVRPDIFIAPYNMINANTTLAVADNGMRVISADGDAVVSNSSGIMNLPETSGMSYWDDPTQSWVPKPGEELLYEIESDVDDYGYAVVTMHPADLHLTDIETILDALEGTKIVGMDVDDVLQN